MDILEAQARQAPAEEAEPKAEQALKGKAPPLAKPKAKPQPQAPHPPSPAPPPFVARKRGSAAVPAEEDQEVEEAQGELKGLLGSLAASKAAKGRAETKVSAWEIELASLREEGGLRRGSAGGRSTCARRRRRWRRRRRRSRGLRGRCGGARGSWRRWWRG